MSYAVGGRGGGRQRATATAERHAARLQARRPPVGAIVVAVAASTSLLGLGILLLVIAPPRPAALVPRGTLSSGELSLQIQNTGWITHDTIGGATPAPEARFQMPASMMPGMPDEGTHRLYLEAVLTNTGQSGDAFAPQEFALRAADGRTWPVNQPASFERASLLPGQTRSVDLYFDIPDTVAQVQLSWSHDGDTQLLPIDSRPPPPHNHG